MTEQTTKRRDERKILSLICAGHFYSHFYTLVLPPLFPLIILDMGLSYVALGSVLTAFAIVSGSCQYPMGILVDRYGPRRFIIGGLIFYSCAIGLMSLADSYWVLVLLAMFAGLGNSTFHPSDYAVLGERIAPSRLGRAYAVHTFCGNLGWVAAPVMMTLLASLWDWRVAVASVTLSGLVLALFLFAQRHLLPTAQAKSKAEPSKAPGSAKQAASVAGLSVIFSPAILMMFMFMIFSSMIISAVQAFSPSALMTLRGLELVSANMALTGWLAGSSVGILVGGYVADKVGRLDAVAAVGFLCSALVLLAIAYMTLPLVVLIGGFVVGGFMLGMIYPSRDLMVRSATPKGSSGRAFGFVFTGAGVGGAATPVTFGWAIDMGRPELVFVAAAGLMMLSLTTALLVTRLMNNRARAEAASQVAAAE